MRSVLIVLLAFITGVLLTLTIGGKPFQLAATGAMVPTGGEVTTSSSGEPAPASSADDRTDVDAGNAWPATGPSPEQVLYAQPRMVHDALARLTPRVAGTPNLYVLAFAGDGGEDVFRNEVEYTSGLFAQRFGTTTHTVILENNPASLTTRPLASWSNLDATLDGLAHVMHPEQDILLLYLTTHGDEEHNLLLDMEPLPLDQIGATDLAGILDKYAFKWKVVVVNACYSGGFVPPLQGPGTLVLTSARTDRSSFGCGSASDITYFGKAWLVDGLNRTADFIAAFQQASREIATWERKDQLTASEPQISVGPGIAAQLALWRQGITPGPAVPFKPAPPTAARAVAQ
ncbi:MAG TPA: C13 family peptidase [Rhodanobacter sp.]|nr:C13 family peptidase [Rhodanobacter sp.]